MTLVPVAVWSNVQTYSRWTVGIAGSNSIEGIDIRLLCLLCAWKVASSAMSWSRV